MQAEEIMTPSPVTARTDESLWAAAHRMMNHPFNTLPIVDEANELRGMLEITDLLPKLEPVPFSEVEAFKLFDHWVDKDNITEFRDQYREIAVEERMHTGFKTVAPEAPVLDVLTILVERNFKQVYVVNDDAELLGVVGRSDILRVFIGER